MHIFNLWDWHWGHGETLFECICWCSLINCSIVTTMIESSFCLELSTLSNCLKFDSNRNGSCKSLVVLLRCYGAYWLPSFIRCFLQTSPCSKAWPQSLSEFSKGTKERVFSFFLFYYIGGTNFKIQVQLCLGFNDAYNFVLYSKTFPHFMNMTPLVHFSMVGITWRRIDYCCCPLFFYNPFYYSHWTSSLNFFCNYNTHTWTPFYPLGCFGDIHQLSVTILLEYIFPWRLSCWSSYSPWSCYVHFWQVPRIPWILIFTILASNN